MKNWASALFPLSVLLALAGLTFWLRYASELPGQKHDGKTRHDPDYIVSDALLRKLDRNGRLQYTLKADDIRHYPDDDTTEITRPYLVSLNERKSQLTLSADHAHLSRDGERVDLFGNVRIYRAPTAKDAALNATTGQLTALPEEEKAFTRDAVLITQGNSQIKGVGMRLDNRTQTYTLESRASAVLESKHARKNRP